MGVEEAACPRVARSCGVDDLGDGRGGDPVEAVALGKPRAFGSDFYSGDTVEAGKGFGLFIGRALAGGECRSFVGTASLSLFGIVGKERAGFVFVGKDDVDACFELAENPFAGDVHHFKGAEVEAEGAACGAGGGEDGVGERGVEEEVPFDVGVAHSGEVAWADFLGGERHGGAEVGAHGALAVGGDEREAAGVGERGVLLKAGGVGAVFAEVGEVLGGGVVGADFAKEGGREAEPRGGECGVGRGSAGHRGKRWEFGDEFGDVGVLDEDHAAFFPRNVLAEEAVVHMRE